MKNDTVREIADELARQICSYDQKPKERRVGYVKSVADGVVNIQGLPEVSYLEIVSFASGIYGFAINLGEDSVGVIVLGDCERIREGDEVQTTGNILSVPVGEAFLGRVINPLGEPLDAKGAIPSKKRYPLEKIAPSVMYRESVNTPLQTGIKMIDSCIPIGRGQRELIIGDRNTGKTALAIDTIINQKPKDVFCIYVAIGQKSSRIAHIVADLVRYKALEHTIIVAASASSPASFQYLAPYVGCALGEYFLDQGKDALVIYDDLTKHAWAYRQISLILRRPSGREAYPGDVFYLHSRLLERACKLDQKHGGGSLTALPIIETQANDISAYIPTNVISITDGQIYLEPDLFNTGQRPAVNIGISVSRVGGAAQNKAMKSIAGSLRIDLAQYRSLAAFAQFATDLDPATKKQIDRGSRMVELLKQDQFVPMPVEEQIVIIWAGVSGYLDDIPVSKITQFEKDFRDFIKRDYWSLLQLLMKEKQITKDIETIMKKSLTQFLKEWKK
jgi:F-type H+-transporting ATPase subunit alpha